MGAWSMLVDVCGPAVYLVCLRVRREPIVVTYHTTPHHTTPHHTTPHHTTLHHSHWISAINVRVDAATKEEPQAGLTWMLCRHYACLPPVKFRDHC